ncbi:hypothetical protein ACG9XW_23135, partial [Acinetobacter guillouiae]
WGYCRAASAVDRMQSEFIVSPMSASGRRDVYPEEMHELWKELQEVKSQATPEGFVLVEASEFESLKSDNKHFTESCIDWTDRAYKQRAKVEFIKNEVERFKQTGTHLDLGRFLDNLIEFSTFKHDAEFEGFVLVDKKQTEDWYLDDHENMWWEQDGIDNSLCDLDPGEVQAIEHKEYLITESNTLYAAKVWDDFNDQVGDWEFFKTKDEADKAAAYCKAKFKGEPVEAQEQSH